MNDWIHKKTTLIFAIGLMFSLMVISADTLRAEVNNENLQISISGTVVDAASGETLAGVNVSVQGKVVGVATNADGEFTLNVNEDPPITLVVSIVGFTTREIEITESNVSDLTIELSEQTILGSDVVVSASRVEQNILDAPVTIEKMDVIAINQTASDSYYKSIGNLKGVDITTSSINFQIINSRGFNSTGNTRMVQLTDGMDTQAPALNFPIGNLNGPSQLDVESLEFIPGASSALYGPNAFNGILLVNSKSPFRYPGLSVFVQSGVNHIDSQGDLGEPNNPRPTLETSLRYADRIGDKFAYKVNFSYSKADDWRGINYSDKNESLQGNLNSNPAYDGVHLYGDDGTFNIGLLSFNRSGSFAEGERGFIENLALQFFNGDADQAQQYAMANLPNQPVARTGYREEFLVDHDAENLKLGTSLHYRLTDNLEASYTFNYGYGTSVYSGAQRYSLKDFSISQHKLQLDGNNFMVRAYGTFENSGDSYIADFVGFSINDQYRNTRQWYGTYGIGYLGYLLNPQTGNDPNAAHVFARNTADDGRFEPGTQAFEDAKNAALEGVVPDGARFDDQSRFFHTEGLYNFNNEIDFMDLQAGISFRQYQLRSNGTIFDDEDGVNINEFGGFVQGAKSVFDDRLRLTGSLRYDKNENFDGQINPRISSVIRIAESQNIRASYQTGFRNPTTQGQYIDLNVLTARLLGGLPFLAEKYSVTDNAYTIESVEQYTSEFLDGNQLAYTELQSGQYNEFNSVKPEQIQSYEIGYKGRIANRLLIDAAYYYNIYDDFIAQFRVRKAAGPINFSATDPGEIGQNVQTAASLLSGDASNTFQLYTNVDETVKSQGIVFGFDYSLPRNFLVTANYNWNELITEQEEQFIFDYNTPEHKVNVSFGNRRLTDNLGFNLAWRWQEEFEWTSSFATGTVPSVSTFDAQVSYRVPDLKSVVKVGGSNIGNNRHFLNYGGPNLGAIYYVSLTFDQFLN